MVKPGGLNDFFMAVGQLKIVQKPQQFAITRDSNMAWYVPMATLSFIGSHFVVVKFMCLAGTYRWVARSGDNEVYHL